MMAVALVSLEALRVDRLVSGHAAASGALALIDYGGGPAEGRGSLAAGAAAAASALPTDALRAIVPTPRLEGMPPRLDVWSSLGAVERGRSGLLRWQRSADWLFGSVEIDEAEAEGDGLAEAARRAYADLFAALDATGLRQPARFWNYIPRINADGGGLERYRQFNLGRHRAFVDAGRTVTEGAPAACALGTPGGPLVVHVLAGRVTPRPIENPRQVSAYHYPPDYGPRSPTFSRAALVEAGAGRLALMISGTASIVGHETLHAGDVEAQTRETLVNLETLICAARARSSAAWSLDDLQAVIYLRRPADRPAVQAVLAAALGPASSTLRDAVWLEADICRSELLVEIEAHAIAAGSLKP